MSTKSYRKKKTGHGSSLSSCWQSWTVKAPNWKPHTSNQAFTVALTIVCDCDMSLSHLKGLAMQASKLRETASMWNHAVPSTCISNTFELYTHPPRDELWKLVVGINSYYTDQAVADSTMYTWASSLSALSLFGPHLQLPSGWPAGAVHYLSGQLAFLFPLAPTCSHAHTLSC